MQSRVPVLLLSCAALLVAVACNPDTVPSTPKSPENGVTVGHHQPANVVGDPFTAIFAQGTTTEVTVLNSDLDGAVDVAASN